MNPRPNFAVRSWETPSIGGRPPIAQSTAGGSAGPDTRAPRVIKRYVNRKLYDTVESRYVTLDEIAHMVKTGDEVRILDDRTGRDLTSVSLVQIIFEEEKRVSRMDLQLLGDLIRGGRQACRDVGTTPAAGTLEALAEAAEQRARLAVRRADQACLRAGEMVASSQEALAQVQRKMNERVGAAFEVVATVGKLKRELGRIAGRLGELQERLGVACDSGSSEAAVRGTVRPLSLVDRH